MSLHFVQEQNKVKKNVYTEEKDSAQKYLHTLCLLEGGGIIGNLMERPTFPLKIVYTYI